ncbi:MAG: hypothetical protein RLY86_3827 [Pseudomonadota bacterium]|jgi:ParB family chromosome partitioning protein
MASRKNPVTGLLTGAIAAIKDAQADFASAATSRFRHSFELDLDMVEPDPGQPRRLFGEAELQSLAESLADHGQLQPILVKKSAGSPSTWTLVAGERRWRAARMAGWSTILAMETTADSPEVISLIENLQRVDLSAVEQARGIQRLMDRTGWSRAATARALGMAPSNLSATLRIITIPADLLDLAQAARIPAAVLVEIARVGQPGQQTTLIQLAAAGKLTVVAARRAREQSEGQAVQGGSQAERGQSDEAGAKPLSVKALDGLVTKLRSAVAPAYKRDEHRARLLEMRAQIDRLLDAINTPEK